MLFCILGGNVLRAEVITGTFDLIDIGPGPDIMTSIGDGTNYVQLEGAFTPMPFLSNGL